MNLKELEKRDAQKAAKCEQLKKDLEATQEKIAVMNSEIYATLIDSDAADSEKSLNDLAVQMAKVDALEEAIARLSEKANPHYTDEDVFEGFNEYAADFSKQFEKIRAKYLKQADELFKTYREAAELRLVGKEVRRQFASHLVQQLPDLELLGKMPLPTFDYQKQDSKESLNFKAFYDKTKLVQGVPTIALDDNRAFSERILY